VTSWFVAQSLNQLGHRVPPLIWISVWISVNVDIIACVLIETYIDISRYCLIACNNSYYFKEIKYQKFLKLKKKAVK